MNTKKEDPVFSYLKEHAEAVPERSRSAEFQLFAKLKELREQFFKKTLLWVPVTMTSLVLILFLSVSLIQNHKQNEVATPVSSDMRLEAFLEESFASITEVAEAQQELAFELYRNEL
ncbi:hypothetical protein GW915_00965 [bacterium]|nr:hypothetical protein [bacterium]